MAKKSRTPPPPRRVQAPKQRHEPRQGLDPQRRRTILYGLAGSGLLGLVVVLVVILAGGKGGAKGGVNPAGVASAMRAAGCTLTTSKARPSNEHISKENQIVTYETYPPTSGFHYPAPAVWGNYSQPVDPRRAVHNQEHGGVVIWVGPEVAAAERKQLSDFYDESPNAMLVTPIENSAQYAKYRKHEPPGSKIFVTAWTTPGAKEPNNGSAQVAVCPRFDEKAFRAFRDGFRGKGPERFTVSTLTPGT